MLEGRTMVDRKALGRKLPRNAAQVMELLFFNPPVDIQGGPSYI